MENKYSVLGVGPQASADEIKSAYRRCARAAHPDRCGTTEQFHAVQAAYALLSDPDKRARYDIERRAWITQLGAVECLRCGHPSRLTRRPQSGHIARCGHCKAPLTVRAEQADQAERQALAQEIAHVIDTVGSELADLAVDGVRLGVGRLRRLLGLGRGTHEKT